MELSISQINELLKKSKHKSVISKAIALEQRLRFHTEPNTSISDIARPATEFLEWCRLFLPKDKYQVLLQLFKFPLYTSSLTEEIYRELERVFHSRNANSSFQFTNSELAKDWDSYRTKVLNEPKVWNVEGWKRVKTAINSLLIIDLPKSQVGERPSPYFYWLDISNVLDFYSPDGSTIEWVVFKQEADTIAVFDDTKLRTFKLNSKNEIVSVLTEVKHDLGYCPARTFWTDAITTDMPFVKKAPITKELSNLDWLLFFALGKRHLDTYAPYPIYSAYEADCDFMNNETGDYCDGGYLRNASGSYAITNSGILNQCPVCSQKRLAGPGSFIEVPIPKDGVQDMSTPVKITTIDLESLTYNVKEVERLKYEIAISCIGAGGIGAVSEKEAINETQVAANFESKTSVLLALKSNFENAQRFIDETICKLRYGADFIKASIDWGTEFYVFTIQELYTKFKLAKSNGASMAELDAIADQILDTEYKNNPMQLMRMRILKQLEPFRHYTLNEVLQLEGKGLVSTESLLLKTNFSKYIDRFERENINVVEFGKTLSLDAKISIILTKIKEYVNEDTNANSARRVEQTTSPAPTA